MLVNLVVPLIWYLWRLVLLPKASRHVLKPKLVPFLRLNLFSVQMLKIFAA